MLLSSSFGLKVIKSVVSNAIINKDLSLPFTELDVKDVLQGFPYISKYVPPKKEKSLASGSLVSFSSVSERKCDFSTFEWTYLPLDTRPNANDIRPGVSLAELRLGMRDWSKNNILVEPIEINPETRLSSLFI